ncbi:DUF4215 domain-containing protein [Candidatus Woesearchaeota archaeon]|nr:DUF4215 domain-containing protein [Candidatus Woesearchaeota archaeon]
MGKRGQGGEAVKYIVIAAVIIFVTLFGFGVVQKVRDKTCNAEIAQFEISLKNLDKAAKYGSVKEFTEQVPCGADEIYFFDLSKDINLDFLNYLPLLKDSVESKAEKNVFLVKDNELMGSFYAGNLDIGFPNYICFLPKSGKINFFLEGKGTEAAVFPGCLQPECTYIPESASNEEAVTVLQEAKDYGESNNCPNCPAYYETVSQHFSNFVQTRENTEVFRKYEYCRETGKTNVEITIRPKGDAKFRNFRYYESIPKSCIDDLQKYLSEVEGEVSIKNDPLMVWMLDDIKTEGKISYELNKLLSDECKKIIMGLGVAEVIEDGRTVAVPEVPIVQRESVEQNIGPVIENIPDKAVGFNEQEQIVIADLWQYANDKETGSHELGYSITRQTNPSMVECSIKKNEELWCTTKQNTDGVSDVTIEVFDGELTDEDTFRVAIDPSVVCGNGIIQGTELCDDNNLANNDGCSSSCNIEAGWTCTNEPSICTTVQSAAVCGDGVCNTVGGESCSTCAIDCGTCPILSKFATLTCRQSDEDCDWPFTNPCEGYQNRQKIGKCIFNIFIDDYLCYNEWNSNGCAENPVCPEGYQIYSSQSCCTPQASTICFEDDAYWQDSCGEMEDKKEECGATTVTSDLRCNSDILERKKINRGCSAGQCFQSQEWIMEQNCGASGQICDDASKSCVQPEPEQEEDSGGDGGGGGGDGFCLLENSLILMGDNRLKKIQDIKVSDVVKSLDIYNNKLINTKVTEIISNHTRDHYYSINNELFITNDHPVLILKDGTLSWVKVENLKIGDKIKSSTGFTIITEIEKIKSPATTVYLGTKSKNFIVVVDKNSYIVNGGYK